MSADTHRILDELDATCPACGSDYDGPDNCDNCVAEAKANRLGPAHDCDCDQCVARRILSKELIDGKAR